jgi:hypothetical protein
VHSSAPASPAEDGRGTPAAAIAPAVIKPALINDRLDNLLGMKTAPFLNLKTGMILATPQTKLGEAPHVGGRPLQVRLELTPVGTINFD